MVTVQVASHHPRLWAWAVHVVSALILACACSLLGRLDADPFSPLASAAGQVLVLIVVLVGTLAAVLSRRHPLLWPHVLVAAGALATSLSIALPLAGTPLGLMGFDGDQSFRTASMTRYADTALPVDFGYKGLPTFFPPLWYWVSGRFAALVGVPGWEAMKWAQIVTAWLVVVLGFWAWRRIVGVRTAALVSVIAALAVPDPIKGDEWLSLMLIIPWWLDAFADTRMAGVRRLPAWVHGIIAGLMLSLYTAFFLPAAVATLGAAVLAWRGRRFGTWLRRSLVLVGVGLVVWTWVWVPTLLATVVRGPGHNYQFRWYGDINHVPRWVDFTPTGLLVVAGLVALATWGRPMSRLPVPRALGMVSLFVGATFLVMVSGLVATVLGHPILVQKTYPMARMGLVCAGVVGAWLLVRRFRPAAPGVWAVLLAVTVSLGLNLVTVEIRPKLEPAYRTAMPDGGVFSHAPDPPSRRASVDELARVIGAQNPVVVSARYDVFVYRPWYNFQQFTESYANPHARYRDRNRLLSALSRTTDPEVAHRLVTDNGIEPIDALVLMRADARAWTYTYRENNYPRGTEPVTLTLHPEAFSDPGKFTVTRVGNWMVVQPVT